MNRFYRYLVYRLYTWRLRQKDTGPVFTVILIVTSLHSLILVALYSFLIGFYSNLRELLQINRSIAAIFLLVFAVIHFLFFYPRNGWSGYIEEFKMESEKERKKGTRRVALFVSGPLILLIIVWIALIFK